MSKTVIRITPVGGFDIPGLENWFAVMAGKGLRFSMTTGPLTIFEKTAQQTVQIHLEPIRGAVNDDPELNALYEDAGWHYWGIFRGSFYVFASDDLTAQAHTDSETQDYALKRFFKEKVIGGVLLAFGNVLLLSLYQNGSPWEIDWTWLRYYPVETFSNRPVLPFLLTAFGLLLIDLSYLLGLFHLLCYRKAIKSGTVPKRHERVGWLLAIGFAFLLPVFINTIQLFAGTDYRPYDLAGSGFITLTDIEEKICRSPGMCFTAWTISLMVERYSTRNLGIFISMVHSTRMTAQMTYLIWRSSSLVTHWIYSPKCGQRNGAGRNLTTPVTISSLMFSMNACTPNAKGELMSMR